MHRNEEAIAARHESLRTRYAEVLRLAKDQKSLLDAFAERRFQRCLRRRATRRRKIASERADLLFPRRARTMGSKESAPGIVESLQFTHRQERKYTRLPAFELDRTRHLAVHPRRKHSDCAACTLPKPREVVIRGGSLVVIHSTVDEIAAGRDLTDCEVAACARLAACRAPVQFGLRQIPCRKLLKKWFRSADRSGRTGPSITMKKLRWS